jgi:hypothetical protein
MGKYIDKYLEPIIILLVIALTLAAYLWFSSFESEFKTKRSELYNECITTDYDKFQCYAMIYGDR